MDGFIEGHRKPRRLTDWLDKNYTNKNTRENFYSALRNWVKCFYGKDSIIDYRAVNINLNREKLKVNREKRLNEIEEGIERYFNELDDRDFMDDFKIFLKWAKNEGYANLSIRRMSVSIKGFFARQDPRCKIDDEDWTNIKRALLPKSTRAATQDKILTKEELRTVMQHISIHGKALALFLLSTGVRIGEACKLQMNDINLDSDPPEVNIREEYTKGEVGGRVMWFSYETRDAIREWHKIRPFRKKPDKSLYDERSVFNFKRDSFNNLWNRTLVKADGGRDPPVLAKRDPSTKNRIYVYHVHTLRKFFSTNMRQAGVPPDTVHAWMGHQAYLAAAYDRQSGEDLSEIYKEHMDVVTVYEVGIDEKTRAEIKETIERSEKLAKQRIVDETYIDMVGGQLDAFADLSEEAKEALSGKKKWNLIIHKVAQLKADAAHSREEIEKAMKQILTTKNEGEEG